MLGDESVVAIGCLVDVVRGVRFKHDHERHVVVAVVHLPVVAGAGANGESPRAWMALTFSPFLDPSGMLGF